MKQRFTADTATGLMLVITDPNSQFPDATPDDCLAAAGPIPQWAFERQENESLARALERQYPFYSGQMEGGTMDDRGIYYYPGDEPLEPILRIVTPEGERLNMYRYGIVAVRHPDTPDDLWVTRMD